MISNATTPPIAIPTMEPVDNTWAEPFFGEVVSAIVSELALTIGVFVACEPDIWTAVAVEDEVIISGMGFISGGVVGNGAVMAEWNGMGTCPLGEYQSSFVPV
jgi:hypothetical protein